MMYEKMNASVALLVCQKINGYPVSKPINHPYLTLDKYSWENRSKCKNLRSKSNLMINSTHSRLLRQMLSSARSPPFQMNQ